MLITFTSCATAIPYSREERCAFQDMKVGAVSFGQATGNNYYSSLTCVPLETDFDRCEYNRITTRAQPKIDYNDNITTKKWINGIGWCLWIIPGVVAKLLYDKQRDNAEANANDIGRGLASCPK